MWLLYIRCFCLLSGWISNWRNVTRLTSNAKKSVCIWEGESQRFVLSIQIYTRMDPTLHFCSRNCEDYNIWNNQSLLYAYFRSQLYIMSFLSKYSTFTCSVKLSFTFFICSRRSFCVEFIAVHTPWNFLLVKFPANDSAVNCSRDTFFMSWRVKFNRFSRSWIFLKCSSFKKKIFLIVSCLQTLLFCVINVSTRTALNVHVCYMNCHWWIPIL